ncbi:hypothetical protein AB669_06055 [Pedobacter sp. BMA]|nr:hypothetical protein AB669_06055 [Pedobacter sp. BMA]
MKEAYASLLDQGWTDAIRTLHPDEAIYTYWDYLRKAYDRNAGIRLDHFLLSSDLAEKLKSGNVDKEVRGWEGASDHAPVWIELSAKALKKNISKQGKNGKSAKTNSNLKLSDSVAKILDAGDMTEMMQDLSETKKAVVKVAKPVKGKSFKPKETPLLMGRADTEEKKIDGHLLKFTHLSKLYWPEDKVSKREMFNYYDAVAPLMLPYLLDRPMSLNRYPGGIHSQSFYQKNVKETAPEWTHTMPHTNEKGEEKSYLLGYNRATLLWMASLGCIEMNPWFSRAANPDYPDYCVIDLDPDKNTFDQVIKAAQVTRKVLDAIGVPSYPKTSGSTGMHIYIPLGAQYTYEQSQLFANLVVRQVNRELPKFTTLERMISNRGGKMYLDFLQNRPGATIAGVYSLRPKPGATVSMPLTWDEVKPGLKMKDFTIFNAVDRLKETGDLFTGVLSKGIDMQKVIASAQDAFS